MAFPVLVFLCTRELVECGLLDRMEDSDGSRQLGWPAAREEKGQGAVGCTLIVADVDTLSIVAVLTCKEPHPFRVELENAALVGAIHQELPLLEEHEVIELDGTLLDIFKGTVVEDGAVLIDLENRTPLVLRHSADHLLEMVSLGIDGARDEGRLRA